MTAYTPSQPLVTMNWEMEVQRLQAENERLQAMMGGATAPILEAAQEIERLREYLQAMIDADWTLPSSYKNAAREALGKQNQ